jgi:hypothetical protein
MKAARASPASLGVSWPWRAQEEAEIEADDMKQIALVDVFKAAQPGSPRAAAIEDMGEGPLDHLAAPPHCLSPDRGFQPRPVGVPQPRQARGAESAPAVIATCRPMQRTPIGSSVHAMRRA